MNKKGRTFPVEVSEEVVTVKIYPVRNKVYRFTTQRGKLSLKPRFSFMVNYVAGEQRHQKMYADCQEGYDRALSKARTLSRGEHDALVLQAVDVDFRPGRQP